MSTASGVSSWLRRALPSALVTMLAVLLSVGCALLIDPEPGPAVLAVALAASLSRSQLERDLRGRLEAGLALPVIGLVTGGVGFLLHEVRWVGAAVFVLGMTASILLRLPGGVWRRIGRLVALPFVGMLIAPPVHSARWGAVGSLVVAIVIGVIAWGWVTVVQLAARRVGVLPVGPAAASDSGSAPARSSLRPSATVRQALQMAVALVAAFLVGFLVFPERWAWVVLTAMLVGLGNRGRADVVHKAVHRIVGSALGTVLALLPIRGIAHAPGLAIATALVAVFVGVLFREASYGIWALAVTVALAVMQQLSGAPGLLLFQRVEEIVIGAVIGVLPSLVLLPIRSADVARLRIAKVLAALQEQLRGPTPDSTAELDRTLGELRAATRPFDELGRLTRGRGGRTVRWVRLTEECVALGREGGPADARRTLGEARRSIREPEQLGGALARLRDTLAVG